MSNSKPRYHKQSRPGRPAKEEGPPAFRQKKGASGPEKSTRYVKPGKPVSPVNPANPARPARPERPSNPENSARPSRPSRPAKPVEPRRQAEVSGDNNEDMFLKGRHEVLQALESGQAIDFVVVSSSIRGGLLTSLRELASPRQIPVKELNAELFERKYSDKCQGVVAQVGAFDYSSLEDVIAIANKGSGIIVALNQVEDARNLGAIVRTVEASGAAGVIVPKHRSAGMSEWAMRTAQGAASYLPVARVNNLADTLERLKEEGFWSVGLDGSSTKRYDQLVYSGKYVLVAGGEDVGLGDRVRKVCDELVAIPLKGKTPSLNVSVSVGIALFEMFRQLNFFEKKEKI